MLYNYFTEKLLGLQGVLQTKFTITENRLSRIFRLLESLFSFTSKSVDIVAHAESGFMKRILFFPVFTE